MRTATGIWRRGRTGPRWENLDRLPVHGAVTIRGSGYPAGGGPGLDKPVPYQRLLAARTPRSAFVVRPQPDAAPYRVEDELRVDAGPGFGDAERLPLADELQWPAGRQRPRPPPGQERVRPAAASERVQDWPRWFGVVVRPAAAGTPGGLAAIGELQAKPEGTPGRGQVRRSVGQVLPGVAGAGPDPRGQEDLDSGGEGGHPGDRDGDLVGPREQQGVDRDDAGKLRLWRFPWMMPPRRRRLGAGKSSKNPMAPALTGRRGAASE